MIDINKEIAAAMKSRNRERLDVLKLIKTELVKAEKNGVVLNEEKEVSILLKMIEQRKDSIEQYTKGGRKDLADNEQKEIDVIKEYVPELPTEEDIANYTNEAIETFIASNDADYKVSMKDMKAILTIVQEKYPTANGKIVSNVLKNKING
jgi:uncharacterized protein YqeY